MIDCTVDVYVDSWRRVSTALHAPCGVITPTASSSRSTPEMRQQRSAHWRGRCSPLKVTTFAHTLTPMHSHAKRCRGGMQIMALNN